MKTKKIKSLEKKVQREAQKALNAVFKKYNRAMIALIAKEIPKGKTMTCYNGMSFIDADTKGRAWGIEPGENENLNYISSLQYTSEFFGGFTIPFKIKSKK